MVLGTAGVFFAVEMILSENKGVNIWIDIIFVSVASVFTFVVGARSTIGRHR
jgi:hypothetical protein